MIATATETAPAGATPADRLGPGDGRGLRGPRKLTRNAGSPLSATGNTRRISHGSGSSTKIHGQANSNMLANPGVDGLGQAGDGFVVEFAFRFVGAFDQHHPARQTGRRAAVVEERQPFAAIEGVALAVRVVVAAQAFEQAVELLQPGPAGAPS